VTSTKDLKAKIRILGDLVEWQHNDYLKRYRKPPVDPTVVYKDRHMRMLRKNLNILEETKKDLKILEVSNLVRGIQE
jgi:hypothetical protein